MNKFISGAVLSAGIALSGAAQSSEFGAAAFSPDIFDVIFNSKDTPVKKVSAQPSQLDKSQNIDRPDIKHVKAQKAKKKVQYQVAQIVGDTYIFTNMNAIKTVKTTDCREHKNYRYYFSDENNMIGSDNFVTLTQTQIDKILALPKCKK